MLFIMERDLLFIVQPACYYGFAYLLKTIFYIKPDRSVIPLFWKFLIVRYRFLSLFTVAHLSERLSHISNVGLFSADIYKLLCKILKSVLTHGLWKRNIIFKWMRQYFTDNARSVECIYELFHVKQFTVSALQIFVLR